MNDGGRQNGERQMATVRAENGPRKKVLVYGAGVIGSFLVHTLCAAGCDVTLVARGRRFEQLARDGLVSRRFFSKKISRDTPRVVQAVSEDEHYDVVFAVMQYIQMPSVLEQLALARAPIAVLVGNNLSAEQMRTALEEKTDQFHGVEKTILFGFQATAGNRDGDVTEFIAMSGGVMHIGSLGEPVPPDVRKILEGLFEHTRYKLRWEKNMDAYLKHHMDLILPVVWESYAHGCDLRKMRCREYNLVLDAAAEICDALVSRGVPAVPDGIERWIRPGIRRRLILKPMLLLIFKTKMGRLTATDHCRHAVEEMWALDEEMMRLLPGDASLFSVKKLRAGMPPWEMCAREYEKNGR